MADGNSSAARRARVKVQLRDRHGKWIEMGAKVRWFGNGAERVGEVTGFEPGGRYATVTYRGVSGQPIVAKVASSQLDVMDVKASLQQRPNDVVDAPKAKLDVNTVDPNNFNYLSNPAVQRYGKIVADDGTKYRWEKNAWRQEGDLKPTAVTLLAQKHKTFFEDTPEPAAAQKAGKLINLGTGNVEMDYPSIADIRFAPEDSLIYDAAGARYVKQADGTWIGEPNGNINPLGNGEPLTDEKIGTVARRLEYSGDALTPGDNALPSNKSDDSDTGSAGDNDDSDAAETDASDGADAADTDGAEGAGSDHDRALPGPGDGEDGDDNSDKTADTGAPNLPDPDDDAEDETSPDTPADTGGDDDDTDTDQQEIDALKSQIAEAKDEEAMLKESGADKAEIHEAQKYRWSLQDKLKSLLDKTSGSPQQSADETSASDDGLVSEADDRTPAAESIDIDDIDTLDDGDVVKLVGTLNGEDDITSFTKDAGSWVGTNGVAEVDLDDQALKDYIADVDPQDVTVTRGGAGGSVAGETDTPTPAESDGWDVLDEVIAARQVPAAGDTEAVDTDTLEAARARADAAIGALEDTEPAPATSGPTATDIEAALDGAPAGSTAYLERADGSGEVDVIKNDDGAWVEFTPGEDTENADLEERAPITPGSGEYDLENSTVTAQAEDTEDAGLGDAAEAAPAPESPEATAPESSEESEPTDAQTATPSASVITDPAELAGAPDGTRVRIQMSSDQNDSVVYTKSSFENTSGESQAIWKDDLGGGWLSDAELAEHIEEDEYVVSREPSAQEDSQPADEPTVEAETGVPTPAAPSEAENAPAELPAGVADNGGLVPQDGVVSVTDDGRKYVADAGGNALFEGDYVASRTDGKMGVVEKIEGNGKYVKVRGDDGKLYGRRLTTLDHITPTNPADKGHTAGLQTDAEGGFFVWAAENNDPIYVGTRVRERGSDVEGVVSQISDDGSAVTITGDDGATHDVPASSADVIVNVEIDLGPGAI